MTRRGFTLIEMLIVMAIVALLLTISLPRYFGSLQKAKETVLHQNLASIRVTMDRFYSDKGRYPKNLEELVSEKYLRSIPVDPLTESTTTWKLLALPADRTEYNGEPAVFDVRSGAVGSDKNGTSYADY